MVEKRIRSRTSLMEESSPTNVSVRGMQASGWQQAELEVRDIPEVGRGERLKEDGVVHAAQP